MKHVALAVAVVLGLLVIVCPSRANACGSWTMEDPEKGYSVYWSVNAGTIRKNKRRVGALYLDIERRNLPRVVANKQTVFDIVRGKLMRRGKAVGTVDGTTITIGKQIYTVKVGAKLDYHGMPAWPLEVVRAGDKPATIVKTDEAPDLCMAANGRLLAPDAPLDDTGAQARVIARVAYYLAWRQLGG